MSPVSGNPALPYESNQAQRPPAPHCSKCGVPMLQGVAFSAGMVGPMYWVEGEGKRKWYGYRWPRGKRYEVLAYRCPSCGLVEHYTPI